MMRREMHVEKEEVEVVGTGVGGRIESWRGTEGGGGVYKCAILHTYGSIDCHVCWWVFHNTTPLIQTPSTTLDRTYSHRLLTQLYRQLTVCQLPRFACPCMWYRLTQYD